MSSLARDIIAGLFVLLIIISWGGPMWAAVGLAFVTIYCRKEESPAETK